MTTNQTKMSSYLKTKQLSYLNLEKTRIRDEIKEARVVFDKLQKNLTEVKKKLKMDPDVFDYKYKYGPTDLYDIGQIVKKDLMTRKEADNICCNELWDNGLSFRGVDLFDKFKKMESRPSVWVYDMEKEVLVDDPSDNNPNYIDFYCCARDKP